MTVFPSTTLYHKSLAKAPFHNPIGAFRRKADYKYEVTVYWKWANTFEQMVLDENSPYKDNPLFPAANTTDRAAMFNYLSTTGSNSVFPGLTDSAISTNLNTVRSGVNIGSSVTALT